MAKGFSTRMTRPFNGERTVIFSTNGGEKTGYSRAENEPGPLLYTMYKT